MIDHGADFVGLPFRFNMRRRTLTPPIAAFAPRWILRKKTSGGRGMIGPQTAEMGKRRVQEKMMKMLSQRWDDTLSDSWQEEELIWLNLLTLLEGRRDWSRGALGEETGVVHNSLTISLKEVSIGREGGREGFAQKWKLGRLLQVGIIVRMWDTVASAGVIAETLQILNEYKLWWVWHVILKMFVCTLKFALHLFKAPWVWVDGSLTSCDSLQRTWHLESSITFSPVLGFFMLHSPVKRRPLQLPGILPGG